MRLELIANLSREEADALWDQGVNMDDWDYILVLPLETIREVDATDWEGKPIREWEATDYTVERLLTGCCSNTFYKANFRGETVALGIAYHS